LTCERGRKENEDNMYDRTRRTADQNYATHNRSVLPGEPHTSIKSHSQQPPQFRSPVRRPLCPAEHVVIRHAAHNTAQTRRVEHVCQTRHGPANGTRAKTAPPRHREARSEKCPSHHGVHRPTIERHRLRLATKKKKTNSSDTRGESQIERNRAAAVWADVVFQTSTRDTPCRSAQHRRGPRMRATTRRRRNFEAPKPAPPPARPPPPLIRTSSRCRRRSPCTRGTRRGRPTTGHHIPGACCGHSRAP